MVIRAIRNLILMNINFLKVVTMKILQLLILIIIAAPEFSNATETLLRCTPGSYPPQELMQSYRAGRRLGKPGDPTRPESTTLKCSESGIWVGDGLKLMKDHYDTQCKIYWAARQTCATTNSEYGYANCMNIRLNDTFIPSFDKYCRTQ